MSTSVCQDITAAYVHLMYDPKLTVILLIAVQNTHKYLTSWRSQQISLFPRRAGWGKRHQRQCEEYVSKTLLWNGIFESITRRSCLIWRGSAKVWVAEPPNPDPEVDGHISRDQCQCSLALWLSRNRFLVWQQALRHHSLAWITNAFPFDN